MCANNKRLLIALMIMPAASSAFAQDDRWIVRGLASYSSTVTDDSAVLTTRPPPFGDETISQSVVDGAGFGFAVEYLWRDRIGIEGAAFLTSHDSDMTVSNDAGVFEATDSTRFRTFTLGANYYFPSEGRARWSVGGFLPLMFADGTDHVFPDLNRTEGRAYDQDYGLGVKGGIDWEFAADSPWTLSVDGRYMFLLIMESETVGDVDVDPFVVSMGIGYRF